MHTGKAFGMCCQTALQENHSNLHFYKHCISEVHFFSSLWRLDSIFPLDSPFHLGSIKIPLGFLYFTSLITFFIFLFWIVFSFLRNFQLGFSSSSYGIGKVCIIWDGELFSYLYNMLLKMWGEPLSKKWKKKMRVVSKPHPRLPGVPQSLYWAHHLHSAKAPSAYSVV